VWVVGSLDTEFLVQLRAKGRVAAIQRGREATQLLNRPADQLWADCLRRGGEAVRSRVTSALASGSSPQTNTVWSPSASCPGFTMIGLGDSLQLLELRCLRLELEPRMAHGASPAALLRHPGRGAALRPGGRREHIVQAALSQQLQRLERELGVLLLDRTTHHVELTAAGGAFLIEARRILARRPERNRMYRPTSCGRRGVAGDVPDP
jgi:Bacterial regulatory helix-turn-helix protein, lysR family